MNKPDERWEAVQELRKLYHDTNNYKLKVILQQCEDWIKNQPEIITKGPDDVIFSDTTLECKMQWSLAANGWADTTCSNCGYAQNADIHVSVKANYCPYCGAKVKNNRQPMNWHGHEPWD